MSITTAWHTEKKIFAASMTPVAVLIILPSTYLIALVQKVEDLSNDQLSVSYSPLAYALMSADFEMLNTPL